MEFGRFLVFMCRFLFCVYGVFIVGVCGGYGGFVVGMGVFSAFYSSY